MVETAPTDEIIEYCFVCQLTGLMKKTVGSQTVLVACKKGETPITHVLPAIDRPEKFNGYADTSAWQQVEPDAFSEAISHRMQLLRTELERLCISVSELKPDVSCSVFQRMAYLVDGATHIIAPASDKQFASVVQSIARATGMIARRIERQSRSRLIIEIND